MNPRIKSALSTLASLTIGLLVCLVITTLLGESPLRFLEVLVKGAVGSMNNLGYSLYYSTPLIFTGLSVHWALKSGLFNIGAEGQITIGGIAMAAVGLNIATWPPAIAIPTILLTGFIAGGLWGLLAAWMKAYRGCHEVLATILLNFVSYGIVAFLILEVFRNRGSQIPETMALNTAFAIPKLEWLGGQSPVNGSFIIAVLIGVLVHIVMQKTLLGFRQRLVGGSPLTGEIAGIRSDRQILLSLFISGGLAGLAGINELLGNSLKLREGFASGAGFMGIAVALLGRGSAIGVILAGILFGFLHKGSLELELDTEKLTRDVSFVLQALIIVAIVGEKGLRDIVDKIKRHLTKGPSTP